MHPTGTATAIRCRCGGLAPLARMISPCAWRGQGRADRPPRLFAGECATPSPCRRTQRHSSRVLWQCRIACQPKATPRIGTAQGGSSANRVVISEFCTVCTAERTPCRASGGAAQKRATARRAPLDTRDGAAHLQTGLVLQWLLKNSRHHYENGSDDYECYRLIYYLVTFHEKTDAR